MAQDLRKFFQPVPRFEHADEVPAEHSVDVLESPGKFVDLFAGYGGASTGATNAGYDVVLAVDNWEHAVGVHQLNHPQTQHLCMELPPAEPLPLPEAGEKWHLHGFVYLHPGLFTCTAFDNVPLLWCSQVASLHLPVGRRAVRAQRGARCARGGRGPGARALVP